MYIWRCNTKPINPTQPCYLAYICKWVVFLLADCWMCAYGICNMDAGNDDDNGDYDRLIVPTALHSYTFKRQMYKCEVLYIP